MLVLDSVFRGECVYGWWCSSGEGCGASGEADISRRKEAARGMGEEKGVARLFILLGRLGVVLFLAACAWSKFFSDSFCVSNNSNLRLRS